MIADSTEFTPFAAFANEGVITTDTFNTWRKKDNGIVQLFNDLEAASDTNPNIVLNLAAKSLTIKAGSIGTPLLTNASVTEVKLGALSVTTPKIADGSITTPKIADGAITTPKIADNAITTLKIGSSQLIPSHLASGLYAIDVSGNSQRTRQLINAADGSGVLNFAYAGAGGQPYWLWGTNDGNYNSVFHPGNFSVNYSNSTGYAVNGVKAWINLRGYGARGWRGGWNWYRAEGGLGSWRFDCSEIQEGSCVVISGGGFRSGHNTRVTLDDVGWGYCVVRSHRLSSSDRADAEYLNIAVFNQ